MKRGAFLNSMWKRMKNLSNLSMFTPANFPKVVLQSKNHFNLFFLRVSKIFFTKHSPSEILSLNFFNCNFPI